MNIAPVAPKVLYIESHTTVRNVYTQLLALKANFQIQVAGNGVEGIRYAERWQPDLILLGLRMPVMDGFEAIAHFRRRPATIETPIVVLSAWDSAHHRQRTTAAGANIHFTVPVETAKLVAKIKRLLKVAGVQGNRVARKQD